jgi:hypothetical protein
MVRSLVSPTLTIYMERLPEDSERQCLKLSNQTTYGIGRFEEMVWQAQKGALERHSWDRNAENVLKAVKGYREGFNE